MRQSSPDVVGYSPPAAECFHIAPDNLSEESTAADVVLCAAVLADLVLQHCGKFLN